MKINFTKKEYAALLDLITMGDWMAHAHTAGPKNEDTKTHRDVLQKIFSHAKDFHCEDKIEYVKSLNSYYGTKAFEEESFHRQLIENYDEETFWEELINRLAEKDAITEAGSKEAYRALSFEDRIGLHTKHEHRWINVINERGLEVFTLPIN